MLGYGVSIFAFAVVWEKLPAGWSEFAGYELLVLMVVGIIDVTLLLEEPK